MWNHVPTRTRWREPRDGGYRVTAMEGPSEPARARLVSLRPVARPRLYEQLVERLLALVHELHLAPGDRFPPERELAAQRRTDHDLAQIDTALDLMGEQIERGERGLEGDERFHAAVTTAAHSELLADLMAAIATPISESRVQSLSQ